MMNMRVSFVFFLLLWQLYIMVTLKKILDYVVFYRLIFNFKTELAGLH
jgi:hypothetical protein